jgi:hypothetical protein
VRKWSYIYNKIVDASTCSKLPTEINGMLLSCDIHCSESVHNSGSAMELPRRFSMQMIMHRNDILALNNDYMLFGIELLTTQ